jgi:sugar phosphate isomerase/epimerase
MTTGLTRRTAVLGTVGFVGRTMAFATANPKVCIFSKHLQFLSGDELVSTAADIGFDGIDVTVRAGGHIDPARAAEDLPALVSLIRRHGLAVPMVTTDIVDADSANARTVLRTMADLGIRRYRWGGFKYRADQPMGRQFEELHGRARKLADLNREYKVCAMYHTHSGVDLVGAPVWDIFQIVKDLDPNAVGINYDVGHATVEGGLGGWIDSFRYSASHIRGLAFKDFLWQKGEKGIWEPQWVPLGEGMVRFQSFLSLVKQSAFDGPIQLHFEYPLGGADAGKRQLTIDRKQVFAAMRRDLGQLRSYFREVGLANG